jgi:hypothetical protein
MENPALHLAVHMSMILSLREGKILGIRPEDIGQHRTIHILQFARCLADHCAPPASGKCSLIHKVATALFP